MTVTAEQIKEIRAKLGISRREFALMLHTTEGSLWRWERGGRVQNLYQRERLGELAAEHLGESAGGGSAK